MKETCYISKDIQQCKETALIFAPNFFRIRESIKSGFESNNIGIYMFLDKASDSISFKSRLRLNPRYVSNKMFRYLKHIIQPFFKDKAPPTYVVVFEGQAFLEKHCAFLKSIFPKSKLIIYCWDSIERFSYIEKNLKYFDKRVTFSIDNLSTYEFDSFVPLFIPIEFLKNKQIIFAESSCFDLSFIGTGHPPKINFLNSIEKYASKTNLKLYESIFLPRKALFYYYKLTSKAFKGRRISNFVFKGKNENEIIDIYLRSRAVIDAGNPNESGLALRIFECLALQKKVILANKSIIKYPFYSPDRFLIFPQEEARINDFLNSPYPALPKDALEEFSPKEWIKKIIY